MHDIGYKEYLVGEVQEEAFNQILMHKLIVQQNGVSEQLSEFAVHFYSSLHDYVIHELKINYRVVLTWEKLLDASTGTTYTVHFTPLVYHLLLSVQGSHTP